MCSIVLGWKWPLKVVRAENSKDEKNYSWLNSKGSQVSRTYGCKIVDAHSEYGKDLEMNAIVLDYLRKL